MVPKTLVLPFLWLVGGCCSPPSPRAEKYFQRREPEGTLKGFVYAVETYQWDYAYASLCASSQKEIGRLQFEVAVRMAKDPVFHEISIYDIIAESVSHHGPVLKEGDTDGDRSWIRVAPDVRDSRGTPTYFEIMLFFVKERGEWLLDFVDTVNGIQNTLRTPPEDLSLK